MERPLIGILAGMGPRSTAPFVDMVVDECQRQYGAKDDLDFPPMMIYSLPAPFYLDRPLDHAALETAIRAGLQKLASTGVALVAMPCNTAHIYYERLAASVGIPLLNMIDEALGAIPPGAGTIALLATRPTAKAGMYQQGIERAGKRLAADESWQSQVDAVLGALKSSPDRRVATALWQNLMADLAAAGVDTIVLACTDLNVVSGATLPSLTVVDATRCLAEAAVRSWRALVKQGDVRR